MVSPQGPSSFIPKSPTRGTVKPRGVRKIYVFTYLSLVLFFGTLIASAGTFFFDVTVKQNLATQKERLANERNAFDAKDLSRLRDLENRIENAKTILATHVSVAEIFDALELSTISTVQLTGIEYERSDFGGIAMKISALTASLNDARFQQSVFASNEVLRSAGVIEPKYTTRSEQVESTSLPAEQAVIFTLEGNLTTSDIPYRAPETPVVEVPTFDESLSSTTESGEEVVEGEGDEAVSSDGFSQ